MAKDDAGLKEQADEVEDLLKEARKKPLNFALMKAKDGVVLKASALKGCDAMEREAKAAGGMPAQSCQGVMNVVGKQIELSVNADDAPKTLAKLAKKHFSTLGVQCKVLMLLPSGLTIDGDAEDDGAPPAPGTEAPGDDPDAVLRQTLAERFKALVAEFKEAAAGGLAGAEKLAAALKAVPAELQGGSLDRAGKLLDAVAGALKPAEGDSEETSGDRDGMLKKFSALSDDIRTIMAQAEAAVSGKVGQAVKMFRTALDSDLAAAAKVLGVLQTVVPAEVAKLRPAPEDTKGDGNKEGIFDDLLETVSNKISEAVETVKETVVDITSSEEEKIALAELQRRDRAALADMGVPDTEAEKLIQALKLDPKAVETFKKKKMDEAGIPAERQDGLLKTSVSDPKTFAAALKSVAALEANGKIDASPAAIQKSLEDFEAARKEAEAKRKLLAAAAKALAEKQKLATEAGTKLSEAQQAAAKAAKDLEDFNARIGDITKLDMTEQLAAVDERRKLKQAAEAATQELQKATEADKTAREEQAEAEKQNTAAKQDAAKADKTLNENRAAMDAKDGKKALLDAVEFGGLSANGKMMPEDKIRFTEAFAKDPLVASRALTVAATAKDPALIARNVGMVADKAAGGFADAKGNKLDVSSDDRLKMAENVLRMGAEMGDGYFKGFEDYLKSGNQLQPDPQGGLEDPLPDSDAETKRKNNVALARSQAMGAAAIKDDGTVDFDSDAAKAAMDHMMFHPGSLKTFTPQMTLKMSETKGLFSDPAKKDRAQQTIRDTTLPPGTAPGRNAALALVSGTMGKDKGAVTDNDAKASVLSAMMTPLSQGPVGSCFSTAPVRAVRETDPLRAMDEYAKLATTGQFTDHAGNVYPANTGLPEGENPLMRSWEYSVATAAADDMASQERGQLRAGLMGGGKPPGSDLTGLKGIVGDFKWQDKTAFGRLIPGTESKLKSAMANELKFNYNAGPQVGGPSGGGDGHSSSGAYELMYKGKALVSETDFMAAVKEIALKASNETETSDKGKAIVAHVSTPAFRDSILKSGGGYTPWKLDSGGMERQTAMVLDGGTKTNDTVLASSSSKTEAKRCEDVLGAILTLQKGSSGGDMMPLGTLGKNANHAFNTLPNDPSLDKIKDPDSARKIKENLVDPGKEMARRKLPAEQAAKMFEDQVRAAMEGKPDNERDLLTAALKKRPTTDMTPAELKAKVATELSAWRDAAAQRRLDEWFERENKKRQAAGTPLRAPSEKPGYLDWFKDNTEDSLKADLDAALLKEFPPPEVVIADTNWGGPEGQVFFVMAPDPGTGDLKIWKKTMPGGKMTPAGKNWADAKWDTVK